ncbi:MAG TPA: methyltransferase domain-containing protein [Terrimicrobiaceae bacterium]
MNIDLPATPQKAESLEYTPSVLVALASYGTAQDHYLERVIAEYRKLKMRTRVLVLSDKDKPVRDAEVVAGLPSRDPHSLPFAHRRVFAENAQEYDLFIYAEDDTLLTERHVDAFLSTQAKLEADEILGFVRSETSPEGQKYITSIHHHFRWRPETVVERHDDLFAQLTNLHSGCFMVTRRQLLQAIASGGFLVEPHAERYGMLEAAATDLFTQCGLRRMVCVSRIDDFIVPHLPNKYYANMGIPIEDLQFQAKVLCNRYRTRTWNGALFNVESSAPDFRWSKVLYEPDPELLGEIPSSIKSVLSVGCGSGVDEIRLSRLGVNVCAVPLDGVFGAKLRRDGIRTVEGPIDRAIADLNGERFDAVMLADVLHLVEDPSAWLRKLRLALLPGALLIASVANTCEPASWIRDCLSGRNRPLVPTFQTSGLQAVSVKRLRRWFREAAYDIQRIVPVMEGSRILLRKIGLKALEPALATRFIVKARTA